ncbi:plant cysteine oxidase 2-like [Salvia miltiorrhiza]|uniref:plant cysteine oxidase 2-like n=1 Tax=Salvia miltiorrhiza TaxID=226208 RepID=UPI0025ACA1D5|nr:plant cysteine oxidase 2-like [Salvia miltiorrhiza]
MPEIGFSFRIDQMTVEAAGFVRRSDEASHHVDKVIKKRRGRKRLRIQLRRPSNAGTLQHLFHCCQTLFKGPGTVPCASDVQNLCRILDGMKPEDVGLSKDLHFFKPKSEIDGAPRVTSATIYKCDKFELCIFFLPETAVIPLHNHPEMTVFNKLLLGTMHIKAYDWVDPLTSDCSLSNSKHVDGSSVRLAKLKANRRFTAPCDTSVLYPTSGGNIHEFTAITPCAFLDVIGPPYSKDDGRDCTFYQEVHALPDTEEFRKLKEDGYEWLRETEIPKESEMDGIEYMGPQINKPSST